jgi:hypothetical protein
MRGKDLIGSFLHQSPERWSKIRRWRREDKKQYTVGKAATGSPQDLPSQGQVFRRRTCPCLLLYPTPFEITETFATVLPMFMLVVSTQWPELTKYQCGEVSDKKKISVATCMKSVLGFQPSLDMYNVQWFCVPLGSRPNFGRHSFFLCHFACAAHHLALW